MHNFKSSQLIIILKFKIVKLINFLNLIKFVDYIYK